MPAPTRAAARGPCGSSGPCSRSKAFISRRRRSLSWRRSCSSRAVAMIDSFSACAPTARSQSSLALVRELDDHAAAVVGVVEPADQATALHVVEPVRHRPGREPEPLRELPGLAAVRRPAVAEVHDELVLAVAQVERLERLAHRRRRCGARACGSARRSPRSRDRGRGARAPRPRGSHRPGRAPPVGASPGPRADSPLRDS